ncbi:MAG: hypothetical protein MI892_25985 [Desulfobacterales bacterium]|nr:hypothetical protein [Desulfobacterales bacterium]
MKLIVNPKRSNLLINEETSKPMLAINIIAIIISGIEAAIFCISGGWLKRETIGREVMMIKHVREQANISLPAI